MDIEVFKWLLGAIGTILMAAFAVIWVRVDKQRADHADLREAHHELREDIYKDYPSKSDLKSMEKRMNGQFQHLEDVLGKRLGAVEARDEQQERRLTQLECELDRMDKPATGFTP